PPDIRYGRIFLSLLNTFLIVDGFSVRGRTCFLPWAGGATGDGDGVGVGVTVGVGVGLDCAAMPASGPRHQRAASTPEPSIAMTRMIPAIINWRRLDDRRSSETLRRSKVGRLGATLKPFWSALSVWLISGVAAIPVAT